MFLDPHIKQRLSLKVWYPAYEILEDIRVLKHHEYVSIGQALKTTPETL